MLLTVVRQRWALIALQVASQTKAIPESLKGRSLWVWIPVSSATAFSWMPSMRRSRSFPNTTIRSSVTTLGRRSSFSHAN